MTVTLKRPKWARTCADCARWGPSRPDYAIGTAFCPTRRVESAWCATVGRRTFGEHTCPKWKAKP